MSRIIDILEEKLNKGQNAMVMMVGDSITYGRYYCTAEETNSMIIDTHKLWMEHLVVGGENRGQGDWLAADPWHFSPVGSYETAKFVFDELNK